MSWDAAQAYKEPIESAKQSGRGRGLIPLVGGLAFPNKHVYVNVGRGAGEWNSVSGGGGGVYSIETKAE